MSIYLLKILEVALTIGFIVLVHEFGHLLAARCCGVRIQRFSVFLSPLFYVVAWRPGRYLRFFVNNKTHEELVKESFKHDQENFDGIKPHSWKDTEYTLGWLPIAGYCMFDTRFERIDYYTGKPVYPYWDFRNKNAWKRLFITISGVLANILLAVIFFALLNNSMTDAVSTTSTVVADVTSVYVNEPAEVVTESGGLLSLLDFFPNYWNWRYWAYLTSIFSICMAVFNMLPIPGLDGGQTIFLILEIALRRKLNENVLGWINAIGLCIVFAWILYVNVKDVLHLFP